MTSRGEVIRSSTGLEYLFKCMQRSNQWVSRQEFNRQSQRIPTLAHVKLGHLQGSNFTGRSDCVKQDKEESLLRQIKQ